ncbi:MAG TPA: hypothetical protein VFQ00_02925 [Terriglobales bacterium]|nr:hypothetical protein [Terriglobales bacterium]
MSKPLTIALLLTFAVGAMCAQTPSPQLRPETAFLSPARYTSAFFGFTLRLPLDVRPKRLSISEPENSAHHFLFEASVPSSGQTPRALFTITADQISGASPDATKGHLSAAGLKHLKQVKLAQRIFWTGSYKHTFAYSTTAEGYVLTFTITLSDDNLAYEFQEGMASIAFFDRSRAREVAGFGAEPYGAIGLTPEQLQAAKEALDALDPGQIVGNTYRNAALGFEYRFPAGWYAAEPNAGAGASLFLPTSERNDGRPPAFRGCTRVLLRATKNPLNGSHAGFNPTIVALIADPQCLPAPVTFPDSVHDREHIVEVVRTISNQLAQSTPPKDDITVKAASVAGKIIVVLPAEFALPTSEQNLYLRVHSEIAVTQIGKDWLILFLSAQSQEELNRLLQTGIKFADR